MGAEEGVLYADLDLELGVKMKLRHDFAGHYNRPDIFQLHVNGTAPRLLEVESSDAQPRLGNGGQQVLGEDAAQPTLTEGEAEAPPEV
jgi:hypothetical protein